MVCRLAKRWSRVALVDSLRKLPGLGCTPATSLPMMGAQTSWALAMMSSPVISVVGCRRPGLFCARPLGKRLGLVRRRPIAEPSMATKTLSVTKSVNSIGHGVIQNLEVGI